MGGVVPVIRPKMGAPGMCTHLLAMCLFQLQLLQLRLLGGRAFPPASGCCLGSNYRQQRMSCTIGGARAEQQWWCVSFFLSVWLSSETLWMCFPHVLRSTSSALTHAMSKLIARSRNGRMSNGHSNRLSLRVHHDGCLLIALVGRQHSG
jgi:hypothetical protein